MAAPVFSYAQAARGLAPSPQIISNPTSSTPSEHGSKENTLPADVDVKTSQSNMKEDSTKTSSEDAVNPPGSTTSQKATTEEGSNQSSKSTPTNDGEEAGVANKALALDQDITTGALKHVSTQPQTKEADSITDTVTDTSSKSDKNVIGDEKEKVNIADDDWEKVSLPSTVPDKELKAAPLPTVNIWQQRREAQQARARESDSQKPPPAATNTSHKQKGTPAVVPEELKRRQSGREPQTNVDGSSAAARRVTSGSRPSRDGQPSQPSTRPASQRNEKSRSSAPPPVGDADSWPTPETATTDEKRRSSFYEKNEKGETKVGNQKNKWVSIPFVPTAKFETELPPAAHSRRGGRPANRGRGTFPAQAERSAEKLEPGSMGPPPLPKHISEQDRGRKNESSRSNRANSLPTESRRNPSANGVGQKSSAGAAIPGNTSSEKGQETTASIASRTPVRGEGTPSPKSNSRSSSRNVARTSTSKRTVEPEAEPFVPASSLGNAQLSEGPARNFYPSDRFKGSGEVSPRGHGEPERDRAATHGRDWQKDKANTGREKTGSWRERGEPRSDRGRGSYRGRGNHASFSGHSSSSHPHTTPIPQNGFDSSKAGTSYDNRNRQSSQTFGPGQGFSSNRNNPRSQSIPVAAVQGTYYPGMSNMTPNLTLQTDLGMGGYGHLSTGFMSAISYQDPLKDYNLMAMVHGQVAYYFSIDNLCKDMFLRRNMDSQGFVPLNVIAEFKRIKTLYNETPNPYEHLRSVCAGLRSIELVTLEDGKDKIRTRDGWKDFILPVEERFDSAKNDGPGTRVVQHYRQPVYHPETLMTNGQVRSPPQVQMNGFHEPYGQPAVEYGNRPYEVQSAHPVMSQSSSHGVGTARKDSMTSPLNKMQSPPDSQLDRVFSETLVNGDSKSRQPSGEQEDVYPNDKIALLKVVVRDPDHEGEAAVETPSDETAARVLGLRGGAGSPEQLERVRSLQFGQNGAHEAENDRVVSWIKDGDPVQNFVQPGFVHEDYPALRDKAIGQRNEEHLGGALAVLYPFWSDFLIPNFNTSMYEEFKSFALEDLANGSENGKNHLVRFYDNLLSNQKTTLTNRLALDIVTVARGEGNNTRPVWQKLRGAWRNGATNLKTRKRLAELLSSEEQAELDR